MSHEGKGSPPPHGFGKSKSLGASHLEFGGWRREGGKVRRHRNMSRIGIRPFSAPLPLTSERVLFICTVQFCRHVEKNRLPRFSHLPLTPEVKPRYSFCPTRFARPPALMTEQREREQRCTASAPVLKVLHSRFAVICGRLFEPNHLPLPTSSATSE